MIIGKGWIFLIALILGIITGRLVLKIPAVKNIGDSYKRTAETRKIAIAIFTFISSLLIFYISIFLAVRHFSYPSSNSNKTIETETEEIETDIPYTYNIEEGTWEKK